MYQTVAVDIFTRNDVCYTSIAPYIDQNNDGME